MSDQQLPMGDGVSSGTGSRRNAGASSDMSAGIEPIDHYTVSSFDRSQHVPRAVATAYPAPHPSSLSSAPPDVAPQTLARESGPASHPQHIPILQSRPVIAVETVQRKFCTELLTGNHVVAPTVLHNSGTRIVFPFSVGTPLYGYVGSTEV